MQTYPRAAELALEPHHVMGLSLVDLSFSQLEALEELHALLARQVSPRRLCSAAAEGGDVRGSGQVGCVMTLECQECIGRGCAAVARTCKACAASRAAHTCTF